MAELRKSKGVKNFFNHSKEKDRFPSPYRNSSGFQIFRSTSLKFRILTSLKNLAKFQQIAVMMAELGERILFFPLLL